MVPGMVLVSRAFQQIDIGMDTHTYIFFNASYVYTDIFHFNVKTTNFRNFLLHMTILVLKNTVDDNLIIIHLLYRMLQFQNNNANTIITNYDY